jgi:integrase
MAIYKRGRVYWYSFIFNGQRVQESSKQGNPRVARQMEAAHRTALAKGEVGIREKKPVPLSEFAQRFISYIETRCAAKPRTVEFYAKKLSRLLEYKPLAQCPLDRIDEALVESYVQQRSAQVSPASVNRELATLRRLLRVAYEWKLLDRVPRIRLLPGERTRDFVLNHEQEQFYLSAAPPLLHDAALLMLDTGLRLGELCALEWNDVHLEPANGARYGYLHVRGGKSQNAKRNIGLTVRAGAMLTERRTAAASAWVFGQRAGMLSTNTLYSQHYRVRKALALPKDFVIHSLRHTFGTRLAAAGADSFVIMKLMGHSSIAVSAKYVHPTPATMEQAIERLESLNEVAGDVGALTHSSQFRQLPATIPATVQQDAERILG